VSDTCYLKCAVCSNLTEIESSIVDRQIHIPVHGGDVIRIYNDDATELVFCENCSAVVWPKEYAPREPEILKEKPKKKTVRKKAKKKTKKNSLTKSKKQGILRPHSNNEDIKKE
jgi:hypothetical protein|tara:strand:- start:405 stop:746 length:342 start_codon:yes stop_codon:yes gene_type:complete